MMQTLLILVTTSIATKLPLAGGTMTGAIAMGTSKITGLGDPTGAQDAATKTYTDTQRDTRLATAGGTMSGAIAMGSNKVTGLAAPTDANDAVTKTYVDTITGSQTSAAASAAAAATSELTQLPVKLTQVTQLQPLHQVLLVLQHHMIALMIVTLVLRVQPLQ